MSSSAQRNQHVSDQQSLLHEQSHLNFQQYYCMACCCPCFLMGNIRTKLTRESLLPICHYCKYCTDCHVGKEGCNTCMFTCCLLLPGVLPFACYAIHERYKLKLFYPDDFRLFPIISYKDWCYYCCCWPVNVFEQHAFVNTVNNEGFLTFQWEVDHYHSHVDINLNKTKTHIILIFGAHSLTKIEFIRKFMMSIDRTTPFKPPYATDQSTTVKTPEKPLSNDENSALLPPPSTSRKSKRNLTIEVEGEERQTDLGSPAKDNTPTLIPSPTISPTKENVSLFETTFEHAIDENEAAVSLPKSKHVELMNKHWVKHEGTEKITKASADPRTAADTIHSWLRTLTLVESTYLEFAEVWDIPPSQFHSYTVKANLLNAKVMLYIVDPTMADDDILAIKMQYSDNVQEVADKRQEQTDGTTGPSLAEGGSKQDVIHIVVILSTNLPSMQGAEKLEGRQYASRVADLLLWARRLGSLWFHVNIESEDNYYSFTKQLMTLIKEN